MSIRTAPISILATAALTAALTVAPGEARAEGPVSPDGKGMIGGALLGAEVVMITLGAVGIDTWWPYALFGAVGAGGGVLGGYFVEDTGEAEPALYMLAGGMALIVPTLVITLNATAYNPEDDIEEDEDDLAPDEDARSSTRPHVAGALIGVDASQLSVGVPAVSVAPRFSELEASTYGVERGTEVSIPVVRGAF